MKYFLLIVALTITALSAKAETKPYHIESTPNGWRVLYYTQDSKPLFVFVPKCTKKQVQACGWNKTSAKKLAADLAQQQESETK